MRQIKFRSVIFGVMLTLLVINTSSSVSREQQTTPLTSDDCHQLATVRRSCVYNTWWSNRWQRAMKPDTGRESRLLPTPLAFDALVRGFPSECRHTVWYWKSRMMSLPNGKIKLNIRLFISTENTNVTDRRADGRTDRHRATAYVALTHSIALQKSFIMTAETNKQINTWNQKQ